MPQHLLTSQKEPWGFIKSSAQNKAVHMELSFRLSFPTQSQPRELCGGYHHGIPSHGHGDFSPMASPPNPMVVPTVTYEYLSCLPSSEQLWPPAQWKAQVLLSGPCTLVTTGRYLQPKNLVTTGSLQWRIAGKPYTLYRIWPYTHG
jgi:hypothetical protein